jgi:quinol monooxygenase YgiN
MNYRGKAQFSFTIVAPPELEAEGDRVFNLHAEWMEKTHYQEGDKALLQYNVAKSSDEGGNIIFILTEVYETVAGIDDHRKQAHEAMFFADFSKWLNQCQVIGGDNEVVVHSLW